MSVGHHLLFFFLAVLTVKRILKGPTSLMTLTGPQRGNVVPSLLNFIKHAYKTMLKEHYLGCKVGKCPK